MRILVRDLGSLSRSHPAEILLVSGTFVSIRKQWRRTIRLYAFYNLRGARNSVPHKRYLDHDSIILCVFAVIWID
jgi:hypothetical protein